MVSNTDLAEKFASGATKGKGSHMFIDGDTIYSYGYHFPIAKRYKGGYLFNTEGYSLTTAKHKSAVEHMLGGPVIFVRDANPENLKGQISLNDAEIILLVGKRERARSDRTKERIEEHIDWLEDQNRFIKELLGGSASKVPSVKAIGRPRI